MNKLTDVQVRGATLYLLPMRARIPLKFGPETLTEVTCARVNLRVADRRGAVAEGWGETPLSVQWVWPSQLSYQHRDERLKSFCLRLTKAWAQFAAVGHPIELGHDFKEQVLPELLQDANRSTDAEPMPWLAALVCCSLFDLALHDAYGQLLGPRRLFHLWARFHEPGPGCFPHPRAGNGRLLRGQISPGLPLSVRARTACAPGTWSAGWIARTRPN